MKDCLYFVLQLCKVLSCLLSPHSIGTTSLWAREVIISSRSRDEEAESWEEKLVRDHVDNIWM